MTENIPSSPRVILRLRQVSARTGLARSTIYARIKAGEFPAQIPLGARAVGWLEADIDAWIVAQVERSREGGNRVVR
jgi:prophage regulatory protein